MGGVELKKEVSLHGNRLFSYDQNTEIFQAIHKWHGSIVSFKILLFSIPLLPLYINLLYFIFL
jgi:hypothetical protein